MASTSAVSMALPFAPATQNKGLGSESFFKPLSIKPSGAVTNAARSNGRLQVKAAASLKEKASWVDSSCNHDIHGDP
ncbi:putative 40S ribosomal protein S3 [Hibiscus syriacus]|uniref:40S ribosomal protein S3 n=1 Tax=Hibiscus syriacus TaxID=106335 RepID=A0A6A2Y432_HIBSY|nr:putative 40S ribosomal protein S3 [Hibiscus syriacus]